LTSVKQVVKWMLRPVERDRLRREATIRRLQDKWLGEHYPGDAKKLIIYFLDSADLKTGKERVSGGLLSIHSLFEETVKLKALHGAECLLCTVHNAYLYFTFSSFQTDRRVIRYGQLVTYFTKAEEIIAHLPEYMTEYFLDQLKGGELNYLLSRKLHVNILNQNIRLMPSVEVISGLQQYKLKLTQTTAHERYASAYYRALYGIPLHHFSTFISPERYTFQLYPNKKNRIAFSPDDPDRNRLVIERLREALPDYEIVVVEGMTYEQFKKFIGETKFTFTFGEGLDGYYCETVLTGGVGFAIYNDEFFTPDFGLLATIHESFDSLLTECLEQIKKLDEAERFAAYNRDQYDLLIKHYQFTKYQENIRKFYLGDYTFP
jgi:hypothetical protein